MKSQRRSRWSIEPIVLPDGTTYAVRDRDIKQYHVDLFKALARYQYLHPDDLAGLTGASAESIVKCFLRLKVLPHRYISVAEPMMKNKKRYLVADHVFELGPGGVSYLRDRDHPIEKHEFTGEFEHRYASCQARASVDIAARARSGIKIIPWNEIAVSDKTPKATRASEHPYAIPVTLHTQEGKPISKLVRADCHPFAIERPDKRFFLVLEVDNGTEAITSYDYERSHIRTKFAQYLTILDQKIYTSHFGFPHLYVCFITTTNARIRTMIELLNHQAAKAPALRQRFLFALKGQNVLTTDWQRAGHSSFNFLTS